MESGSVIFSRPLSEDAVVGPIVLVERSGLSDETEGVVGAVLENLFKD